MSTTTSTQETLQSSPKNGNYVIEFCVHTIKVNGVQKCKHEGEKNNDKMYLEHFITVSYTKLLYGFECFKHKKHNYTLALLLYN